MREEDCRSERIGVKVWSSVLIARACSEGGLIGFSCNDLAPRQEVGLW